MRDSLVRFVEPEVQSQKAKDVARLIGDLLEQLALEAEIGDELTASYLHDAATALTRALTVLAHLPDREAVIMLRDRLLAEAPNAALLDECRAAVGTLALRLYAESGRNPAATGVLTELMETELALKQSISDRHLAAHAAKRAAAGVPTANDEGATLDPREITNYLRSRYTDSPDMTVTSVAPLAGGRSKETLLLRIAHGEPHLPAEAVMRRDLAVSLNDGSVTEEYAILAAIHAAGGIPVAQPYLLETEPALGGAFMLIEKLEGEKVGDFFPEVQTPAGDTAQLGRQHARILAALHRIDPGVLAATGIDTAPDVHKQLLERIEEVRTRAHQLGPDSPPSAALDVACQWLQDHVDHGLRGPLAVLHTDFGLHNQLVDGDEVRAIVDWELATIGPAARDLGYCRLVLGHLLPWDEFVRTYREAGGSAEACDPNAIAFHRLLSAAAGVSYTKLARHLFRSGAINEITIGHAGYLPNHFGERALTEALLAALASD